MRASLHNDAQYLCKDEPLVKTDIFNLDFNDTQWETFQKGEPILLESQKKRDNPSCETAPACVANDPLNCNYGENAYAWTNPDEHAPVLGFSVHTVTSGGICVSCKLEGSGDCPAEKDYCVCKDITDKVEFQKCSFTQSGEVKFRFEQ